MPKSLVLTSLNEPEGFSDRYFVTNNATGRLWTKLRKNRSRASNRKASKKKKEKKKKKKKKRTIEKEKKAKIIKRKEKKKKEEERKNELFNC